MADLSNGANWLKIYDQFHVAQLRPDQPEKHYPIPPIVIPTVLDNYTVGVFSRPSNPKVTWNFGGKVYPLITVSNDISIGKYNESYPVGINETTIFKVSKIFTYYKLLVQIPKWFVDVYLQVWVFTGIEPVNTIDQRLDDIKIQLNRIEEGINTTSSQ